MTFPIRIRLAMASCLVFLVVFAAIESVAYVSVRAAIRSIVDHELETRLAGIDDHLSRHINKLGWPKLSASLKEHPAFQPGLLRIETLDGAALFDGDSLRGLNIQASGPVSIVTLGNATIGNATRSLRVLTVTRSIDGATYRLALATDLFFSAQILSRLWLLMILSVPLMLILAGGAGYWISGKALAPVSGIIAAARSIDSSHLSERISVPATGDEIQRLAETINGMLARIEDGFDKVRQFTANASHELRTPLTIIRANAEIALLDGSPRDAVKRKDDALRRILKEAERDSEMLENMLQLARADASGPVGRGQLKPVDLRTSLAGACADIRPLAEARGLRFRTPPFSGVCLVAASEEQLRRLWLVLLDNAVKYTPAGGTVSVNSGIGPGGRPFVEVSDTGIGIAPEHRTRIFERFYRVDKARSRSHGGAGLGLAIAQHIATTHGASLNVASEPDHGSCFSVTFPVCESGAAPRAITGSMAIFR